MTVFTSVVGRLWLQCFLDRAGPDILSRFISFHSFRQTAAIFSKAAIDQRIYRRICNCHHKQGILNALVDPLCRCPIKAVPVKYDQSLGIHNIIYNFSSSVTNSNFQCTICVILWCATWMLNIFYKYAFVNAYIDLNTVQSIRKLYTNRGDYVVFEFCSSTLVL